MDGVPVGQAAAHTGWSPRMLRYLERAGLVVPRRRARGSGASGRPERNRRGPLARLRRHFEVQLTDVAFAARLRREPDLRAAVDTWLTGTELSALDWEQRKHERLLVA